MYIGITKNQARTLQTAMRLAGADLSGYLNVVRQMAAMIKHREGELFIDGINRGIVYWTNDDGEEVGGIDVEDAKEERELFDALDVALEQAAVSSSDAMVGRIYRLRRSMSDYGTHKSASIAVQGEST